MKESGIKIIITGDIHLGGGRVAEYAERVDADQLFGEFLSLIQEADLSITNLESPVTDSGSRIEKTGPSLKSSVGSIGVVKKAGFGLVTLANNHILDYGAEGLQSTLNECRKNGVHTVGAGMSKKEASTPFLTEISGIKIAILNIAENEFGTTQNGKPGGYGLDPVENFNAIISAKVEADHVIVIVHGGHEHYELPSPRMKKTYRFFADAGATAVIGHHTHCPSGYEMYKGVPICYSLGNFLFDLPDFNGSAITPWNEGLIAELTLTKDDLSIRYRPFIQNFESVGIRRMKADETATFDKKMNRLNNLIADDGKLQREFENYCKKSYQMYSGYIEPHSSRILHAMRNRNILPSLLTQRKKKLLLNLTRCEAHRDVLIKTLQL